jgi:hypothetical protein
VLLLLVDWDLDIEDAEWTLEAMVDRAADANPLEMPILEVSIVIAELLGSIEVNKEKSLAKSMKSLAWRSWES